MKVAIMQPYFMPYIGYFQMIQAVDVFVVYDNIEYTKKGWINRNRILKNGEPDMISLPLAKGSDYEHVVQRQLADSFHTKDKQKLHGRILELYRKAPFYNETAILLQGVFGSTETNLFGFIHQSIVAVCEHIGISTPIRISSSLDVDHQLRGEDKVIALCQAVNATHYINAIGGVELYSFDRFEKAGIELQFIQSMAKEYPQNCQAFVPWLSMIDVLMFCGKEQTKLQMNDYQLLDRTHFSNASNA